MNISVPELPKFVEYEPKNESEQIENKLIEELQQCESLKLKTVANIISEEAFTFDLNIAFEMLQDAVKLLEADPEMAATLFSRWLTMKAEQTVVEVSIPQDDFKRLIDTLYPSLKFEFQSQALTVYAQTYCSVEDLFANSEFYGEASLLECCKLLSAQLFASRKNSELSKLADTMLTQKNNVEDNENYADSLNTVAVFLLRTKDFKKADTLIDVNGKPCDPNVCLTYLREYLHKELTTERVEYCLGKYDELRCGRSDEQTHYTLVRAMSKVGMVEESMDLLKEITEEFFNFDQTIFNVVLDGCSKFSKIAEMQEILNLMDSCGFPLTVVGYNTIIDGLVRAGHTTKAWDVLDSMVKFSILPDHFTISTLCRGIKGPESRKHFDRVIELFHQYREELELRTTVMYNCLLECCVLMRNMSLALSLFEEFKQESGEEKPDLVSYNILLKGYSYTKDLNSALKLVAEMKKNQLFPCKYTYNTLVDLSVNLNRFELANNLFEEMKARGLQADQYTYSTMIKGMKKQTRFIPAEQAYLSIFTWLEELQENKIQVDCVLYNCIMDVCIMYRDIEKALEVYEMMNKVDIEPNYVTFGILIKAYGQKGDVKKCMEIFDVYMVKRKVEVNEFTYGALLEACIKNKNLQKAREVYERMLQDKRITMNTILYSTVLKMLNLDRRLKQSKLVYQTMCEKRETYPNNFSYNTLIDTANKCGDLEFAAELFTKMAEDGYKHDLISFGSMIKGLQKARRTAQIPSYFKQMQKEGMRLDTMFVKTLFNNRNEEVQTALAQLKANRMFIPDSLVERINSMYSKE